MTPMPPTDHKRNASQALGIVLATINNIDIIQNDVRN